ncbi:MAG: ribonuclease [Acidimicrobiia bacterium]|nr:ribonuclease [Acidimicrobiia bacterium]
MSSGEADFSTSLQPDTTNGSFATTTTVAMDATTTPQSGVDPESGLQWLAASELPPEAHTTLGLIDSDGPYPYDQDGATFENREGILPDHPIGYYREFTVDTPGADHRGARRIVVGDGDEFYYTEDHYESFERISR